MGESKVTRAIPCLAAWVVLLGCDSFDAAARFACQTDEECAEGYRCDALKKECVETAAGSGPTEKQGWVYLTESGDPPRLARLRVENGQTAGAAQPLAELLEALVPCDGCRTEPATTPVEDWVSLSPDGAQLLVHSYRFETTGACGERCMSLLPSAALDDPSACPGGSCAQLVRPGDAVHGAGAVASDRRTVVFPLGNDKYHPTEIRIARTTRDGDALQWDTPVVLVGDAALPCQSDPVLSPDGQHVAFRCGAVLGASCGDAAGGDTFNQRGLCLGDLLAGTGSLLLSAGTAPTGIDVVDSTGAGVGPPAFEADGSLVFAASWASPNQPDGNQSNLWRLRRDVTGAQPAPVRAEKYLVGHNGWNFATCVLPDGALISTSSDDLSDQDNVGTFFGLRRTSPDGATRTILLDVAAGAEGLRPWRLVCAPVR